MLDLAIEYLLYQTGSHEDCAKKQDEIDSEDEETASGEKPHKRGRKVSYHFITQTHIRSSGTCIHQAHTYVLVYIQRHAHTLAHHIHVQAQHTYIHMYIHTHIHLYWKIKSC